MTTKNPNSQYSLDFDLGTQLRQWRKYAGLTQRQLEERAGLAHNTVSRIERGGVSPKLETIERLSQALNISVEELQFRPPPIRNHRDCTPWVMGIVERLESFPPDLRDGILKAFHSIIDLMEMDQ